MTIEMKLAVLGAVTGVVGMLTSVAAVWLSLRQHFLDRAKLLVTASVHLVFEPCSQTEQLVFKLKALNRGRRPFRIQRAGFIAAPLARDPTHKGKGRVMKETLHVLFDAEAEGAPVTLEENEPFPIESVLPLHVAEELGRTGTAFVEDTAGKRFKARFPVGDTVKFFKKQQGKE